MGRKSGGLDVLVDISSLRVFWIQNGYVDSVDVLLTLDTFFFCSTCETEARRDSPTLSTWNTFYTLVASSNSLLERTGRRRVSGVRVMPGRVDELGVEEWKAQGIVEVEVEAMLVEWRLDTGHTHT